MYQLMKSGYIRHLASGAVVPPTTENSDYQRYLEWLAAGNTPEPPETLSEAKARRALELSQDCRRAIEAGYVSSVLGTPHTYPTKERDQSNLTAVVLLAEVHGITRTYQFWCDDGTTWARREHTAQQIKDLGTQIANHIIAQQNTYAAKLVAVYAALTIPDVDVITMRPLTIPTTVIEETAMPEHRTSPAIWGFNARQD